MEKKTRYTEGCHIIEQEDEFSTLFFYISIFIPLGIGVKMDPSTWRGSKGKNGASKLKGEGKRLSVWRRGGCLHATQSFP